MISSGSEDSSPSGSLRELSEMLDGDRTFTQHDHIPLPSPPRSELRLSDAGAPAITAESQEPEEKPLESHEVIELQLFSDRKAWIEEKIELLQNMPPVEVFVGLEALRSSAEVVPGLPTRAQLEQWLVEHDAIERETDIFDSGELQKLRKLTKAATQRNLSPEDTDLIELTLTTICALDKLLHLLRDRSDNLDLLGIRLIWEELRAAAWTERRNIIEELQHFLDTRARWSPSVYESQVGSEKTLQRRGSVASLASFASDVSATASFIASAAWSRSARFKMAEMLSRDAAQFATRVTTLRHGKITAAGKALDKLIDNSRKPVPDELLDEQDRLEEKGDVMENVGKFVMNVAMQWRKADEIYVETTKDFTTAENLLEEIEIAKLHHPTSRQSESFASRVEALTRRIFVRGQPASIESGFPYPVHPLFPDQQASNETLIQLLCSEVVSTGDVVKQVETAAKGYVVSYEAVKYVEALQTTSGELARSLESIIEQLENGVVADADGTPPDLNLEICLEPARHSAFLALLPSVLEEAARAQDNTNVLLRTFRPALLNMEKPGIDPTFRSDAAAGLQRLENVLSRLRNTRDDVASRVERLRDARNVWSAMCECLHALNLIRKDVEDAMEKQRWKQQTGDTQPPLTPESPLAMVSVVDLSHEEAMNRLTNITKRVSEDIDVPLSSVCPTLRTPLHELLARQSLGLKALLQAVSQSARLLESIRSQSKTMGAVRDQHNDLQLRIEDLKLRFDSGTHEVLSGTLAGEALTSNGNELLYEAQTIRSLVQAFIDDLPNRVAFVAQSGSPSTATTVKRSFTPGDLNIPTPYTQVVIEAPFPLAHLDDAVRNDSNSYAMRLAGALETVDQKRDHFQVAQMAKDMDSAVSATSDDIHRAIQDLVELKSSLVACTEQSESTVLLASLLQQVEDLLRTRGSTIARSFSPIRSLLSQMDASPGCRDGAVRRSIYLVRSRDLDDAELRFNGWVEGVNALKNDILEAQRLETLRLQKEQEYLDSIGANLDSALSSVRSDMPVAEKELKLLQSSFSSLSKENNAVAFLQSLSADIDALAQNRMVQLSTSFTEIRELIALIQSAPGFLQLSHPSNDVPRDLIHKVRLNALDECTAEFERWCDAISTLRGQALEAQNAEVTRLRNERADLEEIAHRFDSTLLSISQCLEVVGRDFDSSHTSFLGHNASLQDLVVQVERLLLTHQTSLQRPLSQIRVLLAHMDTSSGYHNFNGRFDATAREMIYGTRARSLDQVEHRSKLVHEQLTSLQDKIAAAHAAEARRLQQEREKREKLSEELDIAILFTKEALDRATHWLQSSWSCLPTLKAHDSLLSMLELFATDIETQAQTHQSTIAQLLASLQDLFHRFEALPTTHDTTSRQHLSVEGSSDSVRREAVAEAAVGLEEFNAGVALLNNEILSRRSTETLRLRDIRIAEEREAEQERERKAKLLRDLEAKSQGALDLMCLLEQKLTLHQVSFRELMAATAGTAEFDSLSKQIEELSLSGTSSLATQISPLRGLLTTFDLTEGLSIAQSDEDANLTWKHVLHDVELRLDAWSTSVSSLLEQVADARRVSAQYVTDGKANPISGSLHTLEKHTGAHSQESENGSRGSIERMTRTPQIVEDRNGANSEESEDEINQDVFGFRIAPSTSRPSISQALLDLQVRILSLRRRLRAISINDTARPAQASPSASRLPTEDQRLSMETSFSAIRKEVMALPMSVEDPSVDVELRSLRVEVEASADMMERIRHLVALAKAAQSCDGACSDLLEHIDAYPSSPSGSLSSSHVSQAHHSPEDQLSSRLTFTKCAIDSMMSAFSPVTDDPRAESEVQRVTQTWVELKDMAHDRIIGRKSRPGSVISSGRTSRTSHVSRRPPSPKTRKALHYAALSVGASKGEKFLPPPAHSNAKRAVTGTMAPPTRSSSRASAIVSKRSASGPFIQTNSRVSSSTFASRQRTTSLSSNNDTSAPIPPKGLPRGARTRAQSGFPKRSSSPTISEVSTASHAARMTTKSSTRDAKTWSRAPLHSVPALPNISSSRPRPKQQKKPYVANPKNKLDVAVGDVVNRLPVNINVELASDNWKDQSGKYWIGDQEPKLCFCRILRSQTVMVRVGGGWSELSKFIKDHFEDLFHLMPAELAAPRFGMRDEKWISSTTLFEAPENANSPQAGTPETIPAVPIFSINTPGGCSPQSLRSTSSKESPQGLTPLQLIRRADIDMPIPSTTPGKAGPRPRVITPTTPALFLLASPFSASQTSLHASVTHTPLRGPHWRP